MGMSKLWGKDSAGARGFVFSHVKTIYYNWSQKNYLVINWMKLTKQ